MAEAMLIMASVLHFGKSGLPTKVIFFIPSFFIIILVLNL